MCSIQESDGEAEIHPESRLELGYHTESRRQPWPQGSGRGHDSVWQRWRYRSHCALRLRPDGALVNLCAVFKNLTAKPRSIRNPDSNSATTRSRGGSRGRKVAVAVTIPCGSGGGIARTARFGSGRMGPLSIYVQYSRI